MSRRTRNHPFTTYLFLLLLLASCVGSSYRGIHESYIDKRYNETIQSIDRMGEREPNLLFIKGESYRNLDNTRLMLESYRECQALTSEFDELIANRLVVVFKTKFTRAVSSYNNSQYSETEEYVQDMLELGIRGNDTSFLLLQAKLFEKLQRGTEAREMYRRLLRFDPGSTELWENRIMGSYYNDGEYREVVSLGMTLLDMYPTSMNYYLFVIKSLEALGQEEDLLAIIRQAERALGDHLEFTMALGVHYYNSRDFLTASDYFGKVISEDPTNPLAWYRLGECHFNRYDFLKAQDAFNRVLRLNGDYLNTRQYYKILALYLGREEDYTRYFGERLVEEDMTQLTHHEVSNIDSLWRSLAAPFTDSLIDQPVDGTASEMTSPTPDPPDEYEVTPNNDR